MSKPIFTFIALILLCTLSYHGGASESIHVNISANSKPNHSSIAVASIGEEITNSMNKGHTAIYTKWSPDGKHLLLTVIDTKNVYMQKYYYYIADIENRTYEKIDLGIKENEHHFLSMPQWTPRGLKIYFSINKREQGTTSNRVLICNPDLTEMKALGSTDDINVSESIDTLDNNDHSYNYVQFSPDGNRISYKLFRDGSWENYWIEDLEGTKPISIKDLAVSHYEWYNNTHILFLTSNGRLLLLCNDTIVYEICSNDQPYVFFSISPDKTKIELFSESGEHSLLNMNKNTIVQIPAKEHGIWQANGSDLLTNEDGDLYLYEGDTSIRRLLYTGNAEWQSWFPDGKKILFIEAGKQLFSIDRDGSDLFHITDIGIMNEHLWELKKIDGYEKISISPNGEYIAFSSALDESGKLIESEPSIDAIKTYVATPVFLINADATGLIQITPAIKSRHYFIDEWSPCANMLTVKYSQYSDNAHNVPVICSLDASDIASGWKNLGSSELFERQELSNSETNEENELSRPIPGFRSSGMFMVLIVVTCCLYILQKRRRM